MAKKYRKSFTKLILKLKRKINGAMLAWLLASPIYLEQYFTKPTGITAEGDLKGYKLNCYCMKGFKLTRIFTVKLQCEEILRKSQSTVQMLMERFRIADEIPLLDGVGTSCGIETFFRYE